VDYVVLAARCLVGVVFAVSALTKLRTRTALRDFAGSLGQFGVPLRRRRPLGLAVGLAEATIPVLLVAALAGDAAAGPTARAMAGAGFGLAAILLAGFTTAIARARRRGVRVPCRCFGASATPLGRQHLVRNGLLLAAVAAGLAGVTIGPAGPADLGGAAVAALAGSVAGALVTVSHDLLDLLGVSGTDPAAGSGPAADLRHRIAAGPPKA
jgi:hypothetical protein